MPSAKIQVLPSNNLIIKFNDITEIKLEYEIIKFICLDCILK